MSETDFPFREEDEITYHFEEVYFDFPYLSILSTWIKNVVASKNNQLSFLNFIFCNDDYLHNLNVQYLDHDTLTDIITFTYSDDSIEGDIFISIERVKENANNLNIPFEKELHRVMIHGVLHLLGLKDKTKEDKEIMTKNENDCLDILNGMILDKN